MIFLLMAAKKNKVKSLTNLEQINRQIDFLKEMNIFYKYIISNYTTTIETKSNIYQFNDRLMSNRAFVAYNMIKKDLKEFSANEQPDTRAAGLQYFDTFIENSVNIETCFLVDIKSAYATILLNDGFISPQTFGYISTLPKKARLAAVGMLAGRKDVFYFQGKELTGTDVIINPLESYFWYCVKRTSEIMLQIRKETDCLFYWVDGIYLKNESDVKKAKEILSAEKYFFSEKKIFSFQALTRENKNKDIFNQISFFQSDKINEYSQATKENTEYKTFQIPIRKHQKEKLVNYLLNKKQ
jgi:hypothetical protein